ncbi:MAG: glycosyltransferase [Williamsia sp.]|nr:glycosyltransferase [Williamsia sp.]
MKTALWLASWYPNKIAPFDGDFIQRHAKATALVQPVHVVHVVKDAEGTVCTRQLVEEKQEGNLQETIIYYKPYTTGLKALDQLISFLTYYRIHRSYLNNLVSKSGKPLIVHLHVVMRAGLLALWMKKKWGLPYVITEHWTGYGKDSQDNFFQQNPFFRYMTKRILQQASLLMPVSRYLGEAIVQQVQQVPFSVVPNVADTSLFYYTGYQPPLFRFIHVSSMSYQKNIPGLLRVLKKLSQLTTAWECVMVGPAEEALKKLGEEIGLQKQLVWAGEITYPEVARRMQEASAFVLFSRYETFSCVLIEAACCGLPVIAPRTGGIPENVPSSAGQLIEPGNEQALLQAMQYVMENGDQYDRKRISERAVELFNYKKIGQRIADIYGSVLTL